MINFYANDFGIVLRSCARKLWKSVNICKVTAKKSVAPFFLGHGVYRWYISLILSCQPPTRCKSDGSNDNSSNKTAVVAFIAKALSQVYNVIISQCQHKQLFWPGSWDSTYNFVTSRNRTVCDAALPLTRTHPTGRQCGPCIHRTAASWTAHVRRQLKWPSTQTNKSTRT